MVKSKRFLEPLIWTLALVVLAIGIATDGCFSICPLNLLGADWCPGCGLGHSINLVFKGEIRTSIEMHPLGIPTIFILVNRIIFTVRHAVRPVCLN